MNRDAARKSPEKLCQWKALLPEPQPSKEPRKISSTPSSDDDTRMQTERTTESKDGERERQTQTPPLLAVRHSVRVRKPSVYLLHSVATSTSRSLSHSTALLRRSRQLLINRASSKGSHRRRKEEGGEDTPGQEELLSGKEERKSEGKGGLLCEDLSQVAGVSVDSIFPASSSEAVRWWPVSSDQDSLNQELARRIRLISHSWVTSAATTTHTTRTGTITSAKQKLDDDSLSSWKPEVGSAVRLLFDQRCSVERLASWFMQTTETQSLAPSLPPDRQQGERLSQPADHATTQTHQEVCQSCAEEPRPAPSSPGTAPTWKRAECQAASVHCEAASGGLRLRAPWRKIRALGTYRTTLLRVREKFLTWTLRAKRPNRLRYNQAIWRRSLVEVGNSPDQVCPSAQPREELTSSPHHHCLPASSDTSQPCSPDQLTGLTKQQRLSSKAWSPETLKECCVFLKKINSPDTESTVEDEWDVCTVNLDDTYCPDETRQEERRDEYDKAVKTERRKRRVPWKESSGSPQEAMVQEHNRVRAGNRRGKQKNSGKATSQSPTPPPPTKATSQSPTPPPTKATSQSPTPPPTKVTSQSPTPPPTKATSQSPTPPPTKVMRKSRGRGLTGPRWRDFILGT
ncbi:mediator of DNA damage checkpoint protein 1 [Salmo salar]|uniref:Mediator of DNA damage checkpoint protein 1 n=1 Tax=Salmo salar TaxID=8030 RepID=A0ABM3E7V6_SALSA|nr:mediator of DNA damage checkpoint protein 1-like [Salmo salar]